MEGMDDRRVHSPDVEGARRDLVSSDEDKRTWRFYPFAPRRIDCQCRIFSTAIIRHRNKQVRGAQKVGAESWTTCIVHRHLWSVPARSFRKRRPEKTEQCDGIRSKFVQTSHAPLKDLASTTA